MILENRGKICLETRERTPERWSGKIRNWDLIKEVTLNLEHSKDNVIEKVASQSNKAGNAIVQGVIPTKFVNAVAFKKEFIFLLLTPPKRWKEG